MIFVTGLYFRLGVASCASCLMRLQGSLVIIISGIYILVFWHEDFHQVNVASQLMSQVFCMDMSSSKGSLWYFYISLGVTSFTSCLIRLLDSLVINMFGKSQLIFQFFLHGVCHQWRIASESTGLGWVWPGVLLV